MKAHGKVNLCLLVGAPRTDGLHPLVSIFQPTTLADDVTMEPYVRDSVVCHGVEGDNLALAALTEFRAATGWDGPPQRITIEKRIPVAGGMAGGSADAAAVLRLAAQASGIRSRTISDAPRRRRPRPAPEPARARHRRGRARRAAPRRQAAARRRRARRPAHGRAGLPGVRHPRIARSDEELASLRDDPPPVNDLEPSARRLCRAIDPALEALADAGAEHPMVSGSGPTVFGRADDPERVVARLASTAIRGHRGMTLATIKFTWLLAAVALAGWLITAATSRRR